MAEKSWKVVAQQTLPRLRETKGTVLFGFDFRVPSQALEQREAAVNNVYVKKEWLPTPRPSHVRITVEVKNE